MRRVICSDGPDRIYYNLGWPALGASLHQDFIAGWSRSGRRKPDHPDCHQIKDPVVVIPNWLSNA
tara:strand:- start:21 stop:215 length:195 start_codon:yes stop_codon:yes gene_type:complete